MGVGVIVKICRVSPACLCVQRLVPFQASIASAFNQLNLSLNWTNQMFADWSSWSTIRSLILANCLMASWRHGSECETSEKVECFEFCLSTVKSACRRQKQGCKNTERETYRTFQSALYRPKLETIRYGLSCQRSTAYGKQHLAMTRAAAY